MGIELHLIFNMLFIANCDLYLKDSILKAEKYIRKKGLENKKKLVDTHTKIKEEQIN